MDLTKSRKILNIEILKKKNSINNIPGERLKFIKKTYYVGNKKTKIVINFKKNKNNKKAIIWIPGYNDYFYHYHISEKLPNLDFYAINLRNCGYSKEKDCIPHYCSNLEEYFEELDFLFENLINNNYEEVILYGHSTGGLIAIIYYNYNKKKKLNKINKLILNSPFLYLKLDCISNFILNYIIYYISDYIPSLNINNIKKINKYTRFIKKKMSIDFKNKSDYELPVMTDWISSVIFNQYKILKNEIKIEDIPVLFLTSDKTVNDLNDELGDSILDVNIMKNIGKKLSNKNNIIFKEVREALHDVLVSLGDISNENTSLGLSFKFFKDFINH